MPSITPRSGVTFGRDLDDLEVELTSGAWNCRSRDTKTKSMTDDSDLSVSPRTPSFQRQRAFFESLSLQQEARSDQSSSSNARASKHGSIMRNEPESQPKCHPDLVATWPRVRNPRASLAPGWTMEKERPPISLHDGKSPPRRPRALGHMRTVSVPAPLPAANVALTPTLTKTTDIEISTLKATHAAQIAYLNDDHAREISSLRTHISLLEKQATLPAGRRLSPSGLLPRLDTSSRPHSQHSEPDSPSPSFDSAMRPSSASLRSIESALEQQRRLMDETLLEMESLRSLVRKRDTELADRNTKLSILEQTMDVKDRTVSQMRGAMLRAAEKENAQKMKLADLEAKLELSNDQRLDLEETYHGVNCQVKSLLEQNTTLQSQHTTLQSQNMTFQDQNAMLKSQNATLQSQNAALQNQHAAVQSQNAALQRKLKDAEEALQLEAQTAKAKIAEAERNLSRTQTRLNVEKDHAKSADSTLASVKTELIAAQSRISELEKQVKSKSTSTGVITIVNASEPARNIQMKSPESLKDKDPIASLRSKLARIEAERDQFSSLLSTEIRRSVRTSPREKGFMSPDKRDSVCSGTSSLHYTTTITPSSTTTDSTSSHDPCKAALDEQEKRYEAEVRRLVQEIVLYKLDIKGYKKDLRRANTTLSKITSPDKPTTTSQDLSARAKALASTPPSKRAPSKRGRARARSASVDSPSSTERHDIPPETARPALRHQLSLDISRTRDVVRPVGPVRSTTSVGTETVVGRKREGKCLPLPLVLDVMVDQSRLSTVAEAGSAVER
ncbi:hypothetical protein ANO11243_055070 [Dothideomycetidae sp. 11243]|nr:hypothetical protein ANO11243_055070 [fungal sp. No.11243]